jgi:nucleoside-diphosphate-sugar epimerase
VEDLIEGVILLMRSSEIEPVNIGNPTEFTVLEVAQMIIELSASGSEIVHEPLPPDDPKRRCPDITRAREVLGWEPRTLAREGLQKTIGWFARRRSGVQSANR